MAFIRTSSSLRNCSHLVHNKHNKYHRHYQRRYSQLTSSSRMMATSTSLNSNNSNNGDIDVRILCLHGKGGNGEQFINKSLQPLRSMIDKRCKDNNNISFQWEAITAPYQISPPTNKEADDGGYAWWTMPPGVRSYNAKEYIGFDVSEDMVMDELHKSDIILGHSQGAMLIAALLSKHDKLWNTAIDDSPMGYILNGVAWPNPFSSSLKALSTQEINNSLLPRMLFVMGKEDNINPIESAMQVHDVYKEGNFDVSIVNHNSGHSVPVRRDDDSIRALEEICDWIIDIAKRKAELST